MQEMYIGNVFECYEDKKKLQKDSPFPSKTKF